MEMVNKTFAVVGWETYKISVEYVSSSYIWVINTKMDHDRGSIFDFFLSLGIPRFVGLTTASGFRKKTPAAHARVHKPRSLLCAFLEPNRTGLQA